MRPSSKQLFAGTLAVVAVAAFALNVQQQDDLLLANSQDLFRGPISNINHVQNDAMTHPDGHVKAAGDALTSFGADLFGRLCGEKEENCFMSPLSIASALAMVATGATPASPAASGFSSVLRLDMQKPGDLALWQGASASLSDSGAVQLLQANSLWAHSAVLPSFKEKVQGVFGALVAALPATAAPINAWTADHTRGLIPQIVDDATVSDPLTRAVLVNAVYFKGDWDKAFPRELTERGTFQAPGGERPCMMMRHRAALQVPFAELPDGSTAVALPYKGGRFRQVLVLPAAGGADARSAAALAASLSSGPAVASLRAALARGAAERVRLRLPRFRLEYGVKDLRPALSAAGLRSAFDADGGFLGVADDPLLRLSKVLHKAVVEVNEEGTEAAAATAAVMMTRSARIEPPPREFVADRPFVLVIEDAHTGAPLFMGRVVDPEFTGLDAAEGAAI